MITKEQISNILDEKIEDWIKKSFNDFYSPVDIIIKFYPDNLWEDRLALVVEVDFDFLIDPLEISEMLYSRHRIPEDWSVRWFNENKSMVKKIMWDTIRFDIERLEKELQVPIHIYKEEKLFGISLFDILWEYKIPYDFIRKIKEDFLSSREFEDFFKLNKEYKFIEPRIHDLLYQAFFKFIERLIRTKKIDPFEFVLFKGNLPERFINRAEKLIASWEDSTYWVNVYEDFVLHDWEYSIEF